MQFVPQKLSPCFKTATTLQNLIGEIIRIFISVDSYFNTLSKNVKSKKFGLNYGELLRKNLMNFVIKI